MLIFVVVVVVAAAAAPVAVAVAVCNARRVIEPGRLNMRIAGFTRQAAEQDSRECTGMERVLQVLKNNLRNIGLPLD